MQTLKPEIRQRILDVSRKNFYKYGYLNASLRQIAGEVGITVSNLYKYFKNKEGIFSEVIDEYYKNYKKNFDMFLSHEKEDEFEGEKGIELATALFRSIEKDPDKFVILMSKSDGTAYSKFSDYVIKQIVYHMFNHIREDKSNEFVYFLFAGNLINNLLEVAKTYKNGKWAFENIKLIVKYHMCGITAIR
jgi:AcrR family transcriptional regulator